MSSTLTRRTALQLTLTGTVFSGFHRLLAHDLRPGDPAYQFDKYESITNREVTIRQVYEWPNISNAIIFANISNGLNGFQFSYDVPPDQIQVVVQPFLLPTLPFTTISSGGSTNSVSRAMLRIP